MKIARLWFAMCLIFACGALGATRLLVTVVDPKTGEAMTGLRADDFTVLDDKTPRAVESAGFTRDTLDIMMLLDTSLVGPVVQPAIENFVGQLEPKEQMAVVAFHSSADLIQDFTSSRQLILRAIGKVKYGNEPHVLDALFAAIDGGFERSPFRRVILLLTSGLEGSSRTGEREVIRMAHRNQVSIYPVYVSGSERSLFENLAQQTGGASFNLRDLKRAAGEQTGKRVFEAMRSHYTLILAGNLGLGEKLKIQVKNAPRAQISAMALE